MGKLFFLILAIMLGAFFSHVLGGNWKDINLPHQFTVPTKNFNQNVYSTQLPTGPLVWVNTKECNTFQSTNIHWKSDLVSGIKGISFKGLVFKQPELINQGDPLNSFAVFFHEHKCYTSGSEYGWVFYESDLPKAKFYVCYNCNITGMQKWASWPGTNDFDVLSGDVIAVENALQNSAVYRYWNIKLTSEGNFNIQLVDPSNYNKISVILKKPSWLPDLYNVSGYVTITATKEAEKTLQPAPFMHVDDVKIWH